MNSALILFTLLAAGYLLIIGKGLFVPLVIALFVWFLIKTIAQTLKARVTFFPSAAAYAFATALLILLVGVPIHLVSSSVPDILAALPKYEANLYAMLDGLLGRLPVEKEALMADVKSSISVSQLVSSVANGVTSFSSNFLLVLIYVAFLFAEQGQIKDKLLLMVGTPAKKKQIASILTHIDERIALYVWVKTQLSLATSLLSYAVMLAIGVDFAAFWALLIFILNFIPSIGSIIATAFPVLLALIQFETQVPALITLVLIGAIQFAVGNVLEPKMMGKSLNLSPLVILISLFIWDSVWGITGLFLSIPMTVALMIIFAEFKHTRPIAILLSSNGKV